MTAPHGSAAWIAWVFAIAAPITSVLVAGVALYLSTAATRRERADERRRAEGEASLVSVALFDKVVRTTPTDLEWEVFYALTNDSGRPIHALRLGALSSVDWARGLGRPITVGLSDKTGADLRNNVRNRLEPGQQLPVSVIVRSPIKTHEKPPGFGERALAQMSPDLQTLLRAVEPLDPIHVSLGLQWRDEGGQLWYRRAGGPPERRET